MSEAVWRGRRQLAEEGWGKGRLDNAIRRGAVHQVAHGALLPASQRHELWQRCGAALSTQHPLAAVSRRTAALARQFAWLPEEWAVTDPVCVDAPRDDVTRSARHGLDRRISALPDSDVTLWNGLRVTTDARTGVDLARYEPRDVVVPILDWLLTH